MKTFLIILTFWLITGTVFSQTIANTYIFKVRKSTSPSKIVIAQKNEMSFIVVEEPATFQGGDLSNFNAWICQNLKYPQLAIENKLEGKVYVGFEVNAKGQVENITVLRGVDPSLDAEAVRVISKSPLWTPPKQAGKKVTQQFTIPVVFKLQE